MLLTLAELLNEARARLVELEAELACRPGPCCAAPVVVLPPRFWRPRRLSLLVLADGVPSWRGPAGELVEAAPVA